MIKFHPDPELLSEYVQGGLSPINSIMIAAHCDMCERCEKIAHQQTLIHAEKFESDIGNLSEFKENASSDRKFDEMLESILNLPADKRALKRAQGLSASVELDGRRFILPKTLRKFIPSTGNWTSMVGRLWQAPVDIGNDSIAANLIYIGQGGGIPEHSHRGIETTLVLKGTFEDGINQYQAGDYVYMDSNDTHTPVCHSPQGCLLFTVLDQPLHFTSGVARYTNPFSHIFFR
ncbi:anti-sigma factor [Salinimonas sp. HHU 13199]|uniref:Anti-sigma factor n=1 Tax=Salinimonas profundi TaxID=2729140 RepID=A0ABR8LTQ1_9ALTE|nr:ChrR family anti-sigma-E factor [Salinimonas profundi]MBD3587349.1 anti-sigma factor [Salinimonas profundi]